jgi:hypothetical protein
VGNDLRSGDVPHGRSLVVGPSCSASLKILCILVVLNLGKMGTDTSLLVGVIDDARADSLYVHRIGPVVDYATTMHLLTMAA